VAPSGQSFSADSADFCLLIQDPWIPRGNWTQTGELAVSIERLDDDFIKTLLGCGCDIDNARTRKLLSTARASHRNQGTKKGVEDQKTFDPQKTPAYLNTDLNGVLRAALGTQGHSAPSALEMRQPLNHHVYFPIPPNTSASFWGSSSDMPTGLSGIPANSSQLSVAR
tara:strand:- start:1373 stop:1876 length:504 start_codon:yes stop_codon:yes gene_type:complete